MIDKKILILGAGQMQKPIVERATEICRDVIVADYQENAPAFNVPGIKKYVVSTLDFDAIYKIAKQEKIDGILTTSDKPVRVVAKVSELLGLKAMSTKVAAICTDKYLQRELFIANSITCPKFYSVNQNSNFDEFTQFPYVVKPVDSSASRGVKLVKTKTELIDAVKEAISFSDVSNVLVEEYIGGREFSVETLTQQGLTTIVTVTEKKLNGETDQFFVEDGHKEPANLSETEQKQIEQTVLKAINTIGLDNCPTHTEVKLFNDQAYIIEIACRLGGDYITSDLVPLSTGVDMLENLILLSIGEKIKTTHGVNKFSAVQFINHLNYNNCKDFIENHQGFEHNVVRFELLPYNPNPIKSSLDRMGYIIVVADTESCLKDILKKLS